MAPPGKIIKIDSFKKKDESFSSLKTPRTGEPKRRIGFARKDYYYVTALALLAILLALMMMPARSFLVDLPEVGEISTRNIKSPVDILVEDKVSTSKNRQSAESAVFDVYDLDDKAFGEIEVKIKTAFAEMESAYLANAGQAFRSVKDDIEQNIIQRPAMIMPDDVEIEARKAELTSAVAELVEFEKSPAFGEIETKFAQQMGFTTTDKILGSFRYYHYWSGIGDIAVSALKDPVEVGIVGSKKDMPASALKGIIIRSLSTGKEKGIELPEKIYDLEKAKKVITKNIETKIGRDRPSLKKLIRKIALGYVKPNLAFNLKETAGRKSIAGKEVKPVFFRLQKGEMIVREGERITESELAKLSGIRGKNKERGFFGVFTGLFLVNLLVLVLSAFFIQRFHEEIAKETKLQIFMSLLLLMHVGLVWTFSYAATSLVQSASAVGVSGYLLAAPLAFGPMIVSIFFTMELTVMFTLIVAAITGLLLRDMSVIPLLSIMSGLICAYHVRTYKRRSSILRAGLTISAVNVLITQAYRVSELGFPYDGELYDVGLAFTGGALSALLVSGVVPILESFFPVVSDIKLLELSNMNHPLLRKLVMEAPGTYHHSIMVATLAEEACKAIGANDLLARTGALFHDVGKMKKPEYFVENQRRGEENPHEKLSPSMSTLIITNHIKEGMELARQYKLVPQVSAMIPEHHGTQVVKYFYNKAKTTQDASRGEVTESDFRYPGDIPGTKESACVALADSLEAAARACDQPTPLRLKGIVTDVITDKFEQGQLDNSHLSLNDLSLIAESFTMMLSSVHHHRIAYPSADKERRESGTVPSRSK